MAQISRAERIRRAILREWRGGEEPDHPDEGLHRPGEYLTSILRAAGALEGVDEERLREVWKEVAGDFVARHAEPVSLKAGCLTLRVLQPSMRFHLEQMKAVLLNRMQQELGAKVVKMVRLSVG